MPTLETEGWELESAEERNRANPRSFGIASLEERPSLQPGTLVKLLFLFMNEENGQQIIDCERMWVRILEARDGQYVGTLEDSPVTSPVLEAGAVIEFLPEHIATVEIPRTDPRHPEYEVSQDPQTLAVRHTRADPYPRRWWQFWR